MFDPIPYQNGINLSRGKVIIRNEVVSEHDVSNAIKKAKQIEEDTLSLIKSFEETLTDKELAFGVLENKFEQENQEVELARIQAVLFTALHIEGAVNAIGVSVVGERFYKSHIERASYESKVSLLIAIIGKGRIPKDHPALSTVRNLFKRRNRIAHPKSEEGWDSDYDYSISEADSDLDACYLAMKKFRGLIMELDPSLGFIAGFTRKDHPMYSGSLWD